MPIPAPSAPVDSTFAPGASSRRSSGRTSRRLGLILALCLLVGAIFAFRGTGSWLIREDPLGRADVIVVLSGSMPYRAEQAAAIARQGYAHQMWVTKPAGPESELAELQIHYFGEEEYNRQILVHQGVPEANVRILPDSIVDTQQEIEEVVREMRLAQFENAIIVTSPQHTRRVRAIWRRIAGTQPQAIVRAAREDPFDSEHWWHNTSDTFAVVREIMGLLNVWTGFPVRPRVS